MRPETFHSLISLPNKFIVTLILYGFNLKVSPDLEFYYYFNLLFLFVF